MRLAFFTICAKNYLPIAQTLFSSVCPLYPDADFFLVLCDRSDCRVPNISGNVKVLTLDELGIEQLADMIALYNVTELSTAIKPFVFRKIFEQGADAAIYCDPDLYFLSQILEVETAFAEGCDAVITPHITAPIDDDRSPSDHHLLRVGVYNLGFLALRNAEPAKQFVLWWSKRLERGAFVDLEAGFFTDQKWCDLLPSFIDKTLILRHPGYNVAYWNLMQRTIDRGPEGWTANSLPVRFAHFSGVDFDDPEAFSKHQNRYSRSTLGQFGVLYDAYVDAVHANRRQSDIDLAYGLDRTADGSYIPPLLRQLYRQMSITDARLSVEQRVAGAVAYANSPTLEVPSLSRAPITRMMFHVWNARDDLRVTFPLASYRDRRSYGFWFLTAAERELQLDVRFTQPILDGLRGDARSSGTELRAHSSSDGDGTAHIHRAMRHFSRFRGVARVLPVSWRHHLRSRFAEITLAASRRRRDPTENAPPTASGDEPDNS